MESNKNIKININRPALTPQETAGRKDFRHILTNYKQMTKPFYKSYKFFSGLLVMAAVIAVVIIDGKDEKQEKRIPVVNPPIPALDIKANYYDLDAGTGGTIIHSTGTVIKIPGTAFVDANGKPVMGNVKISYREFHEPVDIIFSGIPMKYDSAGVEYHFETAGMMEVLAFDPEGSALYLAQGKQLDIAMASADERTDFNLYALDTIGGNWNYLGKDKVEVISGKNAQEVIVSNKGENEKVIANKKSAFSTLDINKAELPVKPEKVNPARHKFNINVEPEEFPELAAYKELFFEIGEENKNFDVALAKITWENAELSKGVEGKNFKLKLIKGKQVQELIVYPVFEGKDYDKAMAEYNKQFNVYEATLKNRLDEEQRKKEELVRQEKQREEDRKTQALEDKRLALENVKKLEEQQKQFRIEESKRLAEIQARRQQQWEEFQAINEEDRKQALAAQQEYQQEWKAKNQLINNERNKITRSFSVLQLGIYNCDSPNSYPKGAQVMASFKDSEGNNLDLNNVWLIEKERSAVFTYYSSPIQNFKFNPSSKNYLLAISNEGKVFMFLTEDFKTTPKSGDFCFNMKTPEKELKNAQDFKKYLNL